MGFVPKILGFLCNWCSYAGADLAGVSRIQYPPNVRVVRVMCSGRVDPEFVLEALKRGIDGVIVLGCHPGDCHYLEGNYEEQTKFRMVEQFLAIIGLEKRVRLDWVSASEGARFASIISDFVASIGALGSSPVKDEMSGPEVKHKLEAMIMAAGTDRVRALVGRQRKITEVGNVYGEIVPKDKFDGLLATAIREEYLRSQILLSIEKDAKSVKDLTAELNAEPSEILKHIVALRGRNLINYHDIVGNTPLYIKIK